MILDLDSCYRAMEARDARFDGRFFTGVLTTGIYCRPVCPARLPKRENVRFFPSAAAAEEAGFRACLRCRPETAPDIGAWRGTSNSVARALRLIEAGALDEDDVDTLAARLGIGERQLRRLFRQHLGASPVGVAQTRRVLLAKQLIHETDLSMADVALAAGFQSIRRFNETFQQLYSRPPGALRRRRERTATGTIRLTLSARAPFDWDGLLAFFAARAMPGVERVTGDSYARTIRLGTHSGSFAVSPAGGSRLTVELRFPHLPVMPDILARVRRMFDLAADPHVIGQHLARDPLLAPLVAERPGLRVPGAWDSFELSVRAILGQQISVPAAVRLAGRLSETWGETVDPEQVHDGLSRLFPSAAALADADLSGLPMPRSRSATISGLARAARDAGLFSGGDPDVMLAALRALPGIGDWTANYIAMRALREPDAFPAGDVALHRAVGALTGTRPDAAALIARAEGWRPWRAYAALHLWAADSDANAKDKTHVADAA